MRITWTAGLGLALAITGALAPDARAQVRVEVRPPEGKRAAVTVHRASAILGSEVRLKDGALGKVTDIVINEGGTVDYLVVQDGEDSVAIPWGAVRPGTEERTILITSDVTRDRLKDVRFRTNSWPDFASERWIRAAGTIWGERAIRRPPVRDDLRRDERRDDRRDRRDDRRDDNRKDDRSTPPPAPKPPPAPPRQG